MAYIPPSVIVGSKTVSTGSTAFTLPSTIALVSKIDKYPTVSTTKTLANGSTVTISASNLIENSIKLTNAAGTDLVKDTDYTVSVDQNANTTEIKITKADMTTQAVLIVYSYLPEDFYEPLIWYNKNAVSNYYGSAYNDDNSIANAVTAAASFAFDNGASSVCVVPVIDMVDGVAGQTLQSALDKLKLRQDISTVVPVGFSESDFTAFSDHISWCNDNALERRGIFAVDGTSKTYSIDSLVSIARDLDSKSIMFIPNNIAPVYVSSKMTSINLPGWLYAAAVAGVANSVAFNDSLTRRSVVGFYGAQAFLYDEKNTLASAGCCVLEVANGALRIRQSLVTYQASQLDWSYSGVFDYMKGAMRDLFDPFIGIPSNDMAITEIESQANLFLRQAQENGVIYSFADLSVARDNSDPEIVNVSFTYSWLRPLNWIYVNFSVDTVY